MVDVSEDGENGAVVIDRTDDRFDVPGPKSLAEFMDEQFTKAVTVTTEQLDLLQKTVEALNHLPSDIPCPSPQTRADRRKEIASKVTKNVFFGVEIEGPNRGKPTVFVPGSATPVQFRAAWQAMLDEAKKLDVVGCVLEKHVQVYLGAGNDNEKINRDLYDTVLRVGVLPRNITLEVKDVTGVPWVGQPSCVAPPPVTIVVYSLAELSRLQRAGGEVYLKSVSLRDGLIVWHNLVDGRGFVASLDDQLFGEDDTHPAKMLRQLVASCPKPV